MVDFCSYLNFVDVFVHFRVLKKVSLSRQVALVKSDC